MKRKRKPFSDIAPEPRQNRTAELWQNASKTPRPQAKAGELLLYDRIGEDWWSESGGLTHQFVSDFLAKNTLDEITVRINSPGGDVFEGVGIYNALVNWQAEADGRKIIVRIDALAASIASVIAMAGDEIVIGGNAMMMIHPASTITMGSAKDHTAAAAVLASIDETIVNTYAERTGGSVEDVTAWMQAETYMTAAEAVDRGFADRAEALKSKPTTPDPAADPPQNHEAAARLASARLMQAKARHAVLSLKP